MEHESRLKERREKLEAQLREITRKERMAAKENAERRRKLAGQAVLERADNDPAFAQTLAVILNDALTAPRDRALFELPDKPQQPDNEGKSV